MTERSLSRAREGVQLALLSFVLLISPCARGAALGWSNPSADNGVHLFSFIVPFAPLRTLSAHAPHYPFAPLLSAHTLRSAHAPLRTRSAPHTLRSFGGLRPPHSLRFAFSNNNSHNINMGNSLAS